MMVRLLMVLSTVLMVVGLRLVLWYILTINIVVIPSTAIRSRLLLGRHFENKLMAGLMKLVHGHQILRPLWMNVLVVLLAD